MQSTIDTPGRIIARLVAALAFGVGGVAIAHPGIDPAQAASGNVFKAALRIGHGCDGSPTRGVRVLIPPGFRAVKPMPKPGWTLHVRKERLARPYESHGRQVDEDTVEVNWQAASPEAFLKDAWYDEFVLRGQIVAPPGAMWFKVVQTCEKGQWDWSEVPASGTSTKGLKAPAALLEILPADGESRH